MSLKTTLTCLALGTGATLALKLLDELEKQQNLRVPAWQRQGFK